MKYQLPFGTFGIRGAANAAPFTTHYLKTLGTALELWLDHKNLPKKILLGADPRSSSPRISHELMAGFSQASHIFDAGIIPTPGVVALLAKHAHFGCGIIITASHNPAHDNGIKIVLQQGHELTKTDEHIIQSFFDACLEQSLQPSLLGFTYTPYPEAAAEYVTTLKKHFAPRFLSGLSIGLDCANGAASAFAPALFEHLGARVVAINTSPNGKNINQDCGSNHPSALRALVLEHKLTCGFAFDGDGDRVIAIDAQGHLKTGDDLLFIISTNPTRKRQGPVVGTTMSNSGLRKALAHQTRTFAAANVGERDVIKTMNENGSNLGGEPSGHIIAREYLMCSDGIFAALATLDAALMTNNIELASFTHQPQAIKSIRVASKIPLETPEIHALLTKYQALVAPNMMLVRYSGTEPLIRILLEAETHEQANQQATNISNELAAAINNLAEKSTNFTAPKSSDQAHQDA